jgi:hypothetical protein
MVNASGNSEGARSFSCQPNDLGVAFMSSNYTGHGLTSQPKCGACNKTGQGRGGCCSNLSNYGGVWARRGTSVTVALTQEQFAQMKEAVTNYRQLRQLLSQMEKLSRSIIFKNHPHPDRRKRLSKKVLGAN